MVTKPEGVGMELELVIDFSKCPSLYWSNTTKISYLQRRIIVHSLIYYEMGNSVITDKQFDAMCQQLVELQNVAEYEEFRETTYYYAMHDFDGSTGFHISNRLTDYDVKYLTNIAEHVLDSYLRDQAIQANVRGHK